MERRDADKKGLRLHVTQASEKHWQFETRLSATREFALRQSEGLCRSILDASPDNITITDPQENVQRV